jgi:hypothetical protein
MTDENSWLVDGELVPVADGAEVLDDLYRGHRWLEPDVDELARVMREVAGDPDAARRKAAPAREMLIESYGPERMAAAVAEAAGEALERAGERRAVPAY